MLSHLPDLNELAQTLARALTAVPVPRQCSLEESQTSKSEPSVGVHLNKAYALLNAITLPSNGFHKQILRNNPLVKHSCKQLLKSRIPIQHYILIFCLLYNQQHSELFWNGSALDITFRSFSLIVFFPPVNVHMRNGMKCTYLHKHSHALKLH